VLTRRRERGGTALAVGGLLLATVAGSIAVRVRLLTAPLERDEGEYAYMAQLLLAGVPPYELAYSMKFPGIFAVYGTLLAALGETATAIRAGLAGANLATIVFVFLLGRELFDRTTGALAAASFAALSLGFAVQGVFANTEHFLLLPALAGLWALVRSEHGDGPGPLVAAGLLLGGALLVKQHGAVFAGLGVLHLLGAPRDRMRRLTIFAVAVVLPSVAVALWLAAEGVLASFLYWTFEHALGYATDTSRGVSHGVRAFGRVAGSAGPLWALALVGGIGLFRDGAGGGRERFALGLLILSFLAVLPGLRFRPHYFVLVLPAVALLAGLGAARLARATASPGAADRVAAGLLAVALVATGFLQRDYLLRMGPEEVSIATYGVNPFPEARELARYIHDHSEPDDRIAVIGAEPQIYFYARRRSATRFLYLSELLRRPRGAPGFQRQMIHELQAGRPRFLVFSSRFDAFGAAGRRHRLLGWARRFAERHYRRIGVVEISRPYGSRYRWGDAAAFAPPQGRHWLMLYERRDADARNRESSSVPEARGHPGAREGGSRGSHGGGESDLPVDPRRTFA